MLEYICIISKRAAIPGDIYILPLWSYCLSQSNMTPNGCFDGGTPNQYYHCPEDCQPNEWIQSVGSFDRCDWQYTVNNSMIHNRDFPKTISANGFAGIYSNNCPSQCNKSGIAEQHDYNECIMVKIKEPLQYCRTYRFRSNIFFVIPEAQLSCARTFPSRMAPYLTQISINARRQWYICSEGKNRSKCQEYVKG